MKHLGVVCAFALVSLPAMAQREWALFTADVGGGFSAPVYGTGSQLDYGWNLNAGAGVRPIPYLGIKVDFGYNQFDFNRASAINLGFPHVQDRIFSFTLDPIIHVNPRGPVDFYLVGGGGVYHQSVDVHGPFFGGGFSPFFDASQEIVKPGVNGGAGFQFGVRHSLKFYAEARFHNMYISHGHDVSWVPVTFGVRF